MRTFILTYGIAGLLSLPMVAQEAGDEKISPAQAQALIQEWVKAERLANEEMREWEASRESLNDLLELYEKEAGLLKEEVEAMGEGLKDEDGEREELKRGVEELQGQRVALAKVVVADAKRMLVLAKRFPEPLKQTVMESLVTLESVEGEKQLRDGVVALVSILKEAGRFNRVVTVGEQLEVAEGKRRVMQVVYLGLGRAYYLSGDVAGVGVPGKEGWEWSEREGLAPRVREALAIFNKTAQPGLVELPVEVAK